MKLNTTSDIPLFEQLKNDLLEQIKKGIYISGQQIPTETELSELYHVSRITIRRAITELCNEGVLIKKQGKGTFVKERKIFVNWNILSVFPMHAKPIKWRHLLL